MMLVLCGCNGANVVIKQIRHLIGVCCISVFN